MQGNIPYCFDFFGDVFLIRVTGTELVLTQTTGKYLSFNTHKEFCNMFFVSFFFYSVTE